MVALVVLLVIGASPLYAQQFEKILSTQSSHKNVKHTITQLQYPIERIVPARQVPGATQEVIH